MARVYGDFSDFAAFGDLWGDIKSFAAAAVPSHTIVGRYLAGDTTGAAQATTRYVSSLVGPKGPTATPTPIGPPSSPGIFGPGSPEWLMPVAIGAGALFLIFMLRPRGRRR